MVLVSTRVSSSLAMLGLLVSASARSHSPEMAECAIQFFATGMHGKGVKVTITSLLDSDYHYISDYGDYPGHHDPLPTVKEDKFDEEKAIVLFQAPIAPHDSGRLSADLHVDFTANYGGCAFEDLGFGHIINNGGSSGGSGNCYTIQQTCAHVVSTYGTVYVDVYCDLPHESSVRMKYAQHEQDVDEELNC